MISALVIGTIAIVSVFAWLSLTTERRPVLEAKTLCPVDGPQSLTIVLLDATDAIPDIARRQLAVYLSDLAGRTPEYGLLELRLLDPSNEEGRTVFSKCNPGDGSNLSELVANPALARKLWNEGFRTPLNDALEQTLTVGKSDTSPLMETIQRVAVERFEGDKVRDADKQLIVVSDMIENGPYYSQYRAGVSWDAFKNSTAKQALSADLSGAEVRIKYVVRQGSRFDANRHVDFWSHWITDNGGKLIEIEKLEGLG
ncbi:hypothetical protein [Faunimonas pinastri]|uniref:hypothetical protein n=1 Tax=Faunimonas pinastri TaxID=1855383 RepID=UPI000B82BBE2|nr:hypothetical protein [Faunimonas pinastri]